jgi:arylsulfatase A-like enzyme
VTPGRRHISRRQFVGGLGASTVGLGLLGCQRIPEGQPDIVLLVLDSLRAASLPFYGHSRNTARFLSKLARRSTVFTRCYSAATWTRPSVTSILSGLPPLAHQGWRFQKAFPKNRATFARGLAEVGYRTGFFTANPAIGEAFGMENEFEHVSYEAATEHELGDRVTDECLEWTSALSADEPVFVYIHFWPPHGPYFPPAEFVKNAQAQRRPRLDHLAADLRFGADISLGDGILGRIPWYQAKVTLETDLADYIQRYEANIAFADSLADDFFRRFGVLRGNRRKMVIVTGDHGEGLGEHGLVCDHGKLLIDEILHVPLLIHDTARPKGAVIEDVVSHLDLAPTILELGGASRDFGMLNEPLFAEKTRGRIVVSQEGISNGESGWALTSDQWRLVYNGGVRYGGSNIMATTFAAPVDGVPGFLPLPPPRTALRWPVRVATEVVLESLALSNRVFSSGEPIGFAGVLRAPGGGGSLSLRARIPGGRPIDLGLYTAGRFEGVIPPIDWPELDSWLLVEGLWSDGSTSTAHSSDWFRVLTVPVSMPRRMAGDLELAAIDVAPSVALPGTAVRVDLVWRASQNIDRKVGIIIGLVDEAQRPVIREFGTFFRPLPDPDAKPRPLVDLFKLSDTTFQNGSLLFDDALWWTLPPNLSPGRYGIEVGLVNYPQLFNFDNLIVTKEPVVCARLEVVDSTEDSLRICAAGDLGLQCISIAHDFVPNLNERPVLEDLGDRHPEQGQIDYLLALTASDRTLRRRHLEACRTKVPFHYAANRELAVLGNTDAIDRIAELTPSHELEVEFNGLLRLYGFDLCRRDLNVFLTLYWHADAICRHLFSATLFCEMKKSSGDPSGFSCWWFLGGVKRPSYSWLIGEVVRETIRIPIDPATADMNVRLHLEEQWRRLYSDERNSSAVTTGNGEERRVLIAELGVHRVEDLATDCVDFLTLKRTDPGQYLLFDLAHDPGQLHDLSSSRPEVFAGLSRQLGDLLVAGESWAAGLDEAEAELSEATREQLEALGYVE